MVYAVNAIVRGRVQGVFFRHYTRQRAEELGLAGWVRNLPDGTVEVWAEGTEEQLSELTEWLKLGSPLAAVDAVKIDRPAPKGLTGFSVTY